ncbi:MAG: DHA2 family efflux MFS transporter permease subunit [Alphaproteobacteria bacterium]
MTNAAIGTGDVPGVSFAHRWLVVVTSLSSSLALALSGTITNVAVPDIMGTFGVGQDQAQWMATAFFAAMTAGMLISDWLVRSFGQRYTFVTSMLLFFMACIIGGMAQTYGIVVLSRTLQGFAAGVILPLTMMAMFGVFPPNRRAMVAGLFGISFVLGPGFGPWFGGLAIDAFNWRFTFYVALPVAFCSMLLASVVFPNRDKSVPLTGFDWFGFLLVTVFLMATLTGLSNGQLKGWNSNFVLGALGLGIGSLIAFVCWELYVDDPIFDVRLLRYPRFALACMVSFLFGATLFGSFYLQPVFVQLVENYTPSRAGLVLVPGGVALGLVLPIAGRLSDKFPPYWPLVLGFSLFAVSTWFMGIADANTAFWTFAILVVIGRIGQGMLFPPVTAAGLQATPAERMGMANGMLNFTRQAGGAFGINLLAIFIERRTAFFAELLATTQTEANAATQGLLTGVRELLSGSGLPDAIQAPLATLYLGRMVAAQATALAFQDTFMLFALVAGFAALLSFTLWSPYRRQ